VPAIRALVRAHRGTSLAVCRTLLRSQWHEERMLALLLMVDAYPRGDLAQRQAIVDAYLANLPHVNNWDLVDSSAPHILGAHLAPTDTAVLDALAASDNLWARRVAMLATQFHVRRDEFAPAIRIATALRHDPHPLLHKAVGWMLREVGERDRDTELAFLVRHWRTMPRTAVRYAIEKLPPSDRRRFMR
jgi:3-methyladenine DNA glycosylase AlkD